MNWMTIEFFPWGGMPLRIWIDGMSIEWPRDSHVLAIKI